MFRRRTAIFLAICAALVACSSPQPAAIPDNTTLIMLRHADRDDAQLSDQGRARAQALVGALEGIPVDAIYAPDIQRNIDTGAPLATARNMDLILVERFDAVDAFLNAVTQSGGQTIVWVGNKDNLAPIWDALSLEGPAPVNYGDLFIVATGSGGPPQITRRQFGAN